MRLELKEECLKIEALGYDIVYADECVFTTKTMKMHEYT